jgi:hypothetical protein
VAAEPAHPVGEPGEGAAVVAPSPDRRSLRLKRADAPPTRIEPKPTAPVPIIRTAAIVSRVESESAGMAGQIRMSIMRRMTRLPMNIQVPSAARPYLIAFSCITSL